jgi:hypothetical protein
VGWNLQSTIHNPSSHLHALECGTHHDHYRRGIGTSKRRHKDLTPPTYIRFTDGNYQFILGAQIPELLMGLEATVHMYIDLPLTKGKKKKKRKS